MNNRRLIYFVIFLLCSIIFFIFTKNRQLKPNISNTEIAYPISPTKTTNSPMTIETKNLKYAYDYIITKPRDITLIPNFREKLTTNEIIKTYNCQKAVNGGFYKENNTPLGLFISNSHILNEALESNFFNAFFWIDNKGQATISISRPQEDMPIAMQSGPLLYDNGKPVPISIAEDEPARRNVLALTKEQEVIFITFFDSEQTLYGPYLSITPELIQSIDEKYGFSIEKAMNLDGGSASAFITEGQKLYELVTVGSLFCIQ